MIKRADFKRGKLGDVYMGAHMYLFYKDADYDHVTTAQHILNANGYYNSNLYATYFQLEKLKVIVFIGIHT